jgi:bacterioferritin-associated ferredoxin
MYICLCNGYTDRQVRKAAPGCTTVSDVYRTLGAPPRCGKCVPMVADLCRGAFGEEPCANGSDD